MEAVSGHTGITVSYILPNLRKNTIRIIMTKTISESKCNLSNYNHIHIHIFMVVSMVTEFYQMKEKVICYITVYGCYGLFYNLEFLQFFNQNCSILLKKPTVRGLRTAIDLSNSSSITFLHPVTILT